MCNVDWGLYRNFRDYEFRCNCCGLLNVKPELLDSLQALRDHVGVPVQVTSGTRCPAHNRAVGGAPGSRHLVGEAADIVIYAMDVLEMYHSAEQIWQGTGGIGIYPTNGFVHVDVRGNRKRWSTIYGETFSGIEDAYDWVTEHGLRRVRR